MTDSLLPGENLRVFGADFDYINRDDFFAQKPEFLQKYLSRHGDCFARVSNADSSLGHELAIRDAAIDFLKDELDAISFAVTKYAVLMRLGTLLQGGAPEELKTAIAEAFEALEAEVG